MAVGVRILRQNLFDDATISTDNEVTSLPATNTQDAQLSKVWRTSATSAYLQIDMLSSLTIGFAGFFGCNFTTAGTYRLRGSNTAYTTGDIVDTTLSASLVSTRRQQALKFLTNLPQARYWRWDLSDASLSYLQVGRAVMGPTIAPNRDWAFPAELGSQDLSQRQVTPRGNIFVATGPVRRTADFTMPVMSEAEAWADIDRDKDFGLSGDVLVSLDINDATYLQQKTLWGSIEDVTPVSWRAHGLLGRRYRVTERVSDLS